MLQCPGRPEAEACSMPSALSGSEQGFLALKLSLGTGPRFSAALAIRLSRQAKPELMVCSELRMWLQSCGSGLFCQLCSRRRRS